MVFNAANSQEEAKKKKKKIRRKNNSNNKNATNIGRRNDLKSIVKKKDNQNKTKNTNTNFIDIIEQWRIIVKGRKDL